MSAHLPPDSDPVSAADAEFANYLTMILQAFGIPQVPEEALRFLLMAAAAVTPLLEVGRDAGTSEWLTPGVLDAVERARDALSEARDQLEQVIDDVGIAINELDPTALDGAVQNRGGLR